MSAKTKRLHQLARRMQDAVKAQLPEDEPDEVRWWVYLECAKVAVKELAPNQALVEARATAKRYQRMVCGRPVACSDHPLPWEA